MNIFAKDFPMLNFAAAVLQLVFLKDDKKEQIRIKRSHIVE